MFLRCVILGIVGKLKTEVAQDNSAVFVLRLSAIDVETLDVELLMYHILKVGINPLLGLNTKTFLQVITTTIHTERQFDVILDCTSFSPMSEVPLQWLKYCAELIPLDIRLRFATVHILNPNTLTQKYLRRLYNISAGIHSSFLSNTTLTRIQVYDSVLRLKHTPLYEASKRMFTPRLCLN